MGVTHPVSEAPKTNFLNQISTHLITMKLNELFTNNAPVSVKWEDYDGNAVNAYYVDNEDEIIVSFDSYPEETSEEIIEVSFTRNGSITTDQQGNSIKVFSVVTNIIETYIKRYKPNRIVFMADNSKINLYKRLVAKLTKNTPYMPLSTNDLPLIKIKDYEFISIGLKEIYANKQST